MELSFALAVNVIRKLATAVAAAGGLDFSSAGNSQYATVIFTGF